MRYLLVLTLMVSLQGFAEDIPGFANLVKIGNRIFARGLPANHPEVARQLRELILRNSDQLRVAASARIITVDLDHGVSKSYRGMPDCIVKARALNFLLNTITDLKTRTLVRVDERQACAQGFLRLNLNGLIRPELLALLVNENPRNCGGNGNASVDLAWLIDRAMQPDIYYRLVGMPRTLKEKAQRLGIAPDKRQTAGNKVDVAGPPNRDALPGDGLNTESIVGLNAHRVLEVQPTRNIVGGYCLTSYDNKKNNAQGTDTDATDVFKNGINSTHVASEGICTKANGFLSWDLYNVAGQIQQNAPADVALADRRFADPLTRGLGADVTAPVACMTCHENGLLYSGNSFKTGKPYHDNFGNVPASSRAFFTTKPVFDRFEQIVSITYKNSIIRSGSCVPRAGTDRCEPVLPDLTARFRQDLTTAQAAKELGVSQGAFLAGLRSLGIPLKADGKIQRSVFSTGRTYCALRQAALANRGAFAERTRAGRALASEDTPRHGERGDQ